MSGAYNNIPAELRALRQWVNWRYEQRDGEKPTKIPLNSVTGDKASVTNPMHWNTFEYAVSMVDLCAGIGFVFTKSDPYCGVDIDDYNNPVRASTCADIITKLGSYSELSPSGAGVHVIARAALPNSGRRRNGIEIYDTARFFTFTGAHLDGTPWHIKDAQNAISELYGDCARQADIDILDFSKPAVLSDHEVYQHAAAAYNGGKFLDLWEGRWQLHYGNHSQSEADLALVNILAFHSDNADQIARLFRSSALGSRHKARRNDYVYKWLIRKAFDRKPRKADLDQIHNRWLEIQARRNHDA